jgi:hypothetical protein
MFADERQATTPMRRVSGDDAPTTMFEQAPPRIGRLSRWLDAVVVTTALLLVFAVAMFTMVLLAG